MHKDDNATGLYQWSSNDGHVYLLQTLFPILKTLEHEKIVYIFKKTSNSTLVDVPIFKDRYGIEFKLVTKEVVSTYMFGGLSLLVETLSRNKPKLESSTFVNISNSSKPNL